MTAVVARAASLSGGVGVRRSSAALAGGLLLLVESGAQAQVGALVSIYSDDRYRGVSLSDGRPVGILDLSYDARNGAYAALSGRIVATRTERLQPLGFSVNGGYATRLNSRLTADVGIVHSRYSSYSGLAGRRSYTEVYAGVSGKLLGARVSISPDYLGTANWTAYAEVDGHLDLSRRTLLDARVGVLAPVRSNYYSMNRPQFDGRLGLAHRLGRVTLHGAFTTRSKAYFYRGGMRRGTALVAGISTAF